MVERVGQGRHVAAAARRANADGIRGVVPHVETHVFVGAVAVVAVLLVWWAVFANRLIDERQALAAQLARATLTDAVHLSTVLDEQSVLAARQRTMILGEGSIFAAMLLVCVAILFVTARQARLASLRLVRLLQFTTHELKTPIAGVRALLQSLQIGSIPEDARGRFLEQGLLECSRLEHLTETILAFQRATARAKLHPLPVTSVELVTDVLEHRRRTFNAEQVERPGAPSVELSVDKDAFRVVLENLLDNARKYGGGAPVELRESSADGQWRLEVRDRGDGFEPGEGERLFLPFERESREGSSVHGSGLGLYISRQLMREMGGDLRAHSDGRGRGATFVVEMPIVKLHAAEGARRV